MTPGPAQNAVRSAGTGGILLPVLKQLDDCVEISAEPGRGSVRLRGAERPWNDEVLDFQCELADAGVNAATWVRRSAATGSSRGQLIWPSRTADGTASVPGSHLNMTSGSMRCMTDEVTSVSASSSGDPGPTNQDLHGDTRNVVLTLARIWTTLATGKTGHWEDQVQGRRRRLGSPLP